MDNNLKRAYMIYDNWMSEAEENPRFDLDKIWAANVIAYAPTHHGISKDGLCEIIKYLCKLAVMNPNTTDTDIHEAPNSFRHGNVRLINADELIRYILGKLEKDTLTDEEAFACGYACGIVSRFAELHNVVEIPEEVLHLQDQIVYKVWNGGVLTYRVVGFKLLYTKDGFSFALLLTDADMDVDEWEFTADYVDPGEYNKTVFLDRRKAEEVYEDLCSGCRDIEKKSCTVDMPEGLREYYRSKDTLLVNQTFGDRPAVPAGSGERITFKKFEKLDGGDVLC